MIVPGITSKLYSDNYLSIGFSPSQGNIGKSEKEYNRDYEGQWDSFEVVDCSYRGVERTTTRFLVGKSGVSINLTDANNHHKTKKDMEAVELALRENERLSRVRRYCKSVLDVAN